MKMPFDLPRNKDEVEVVFFIMEGFWVGFRFFIVPLTIFFVVHGAKKLMHS